MIYRSLSFFFVIFLSINSYSQPDNIYKLRADTIANALDHIETGRHLWPKAGWWNAANILEAKLNYQLLSGKRNALCIKSTYALNVMIGRGKFQNEFYDDNGWWALAWIRAYDVYHQQKYLDIGKGIFADMESTGRDSLCGGGMVWNRKKRYKNAVTNELYILLAARLASHTSDSAQRKFYLRLAIQDWTWLYHSGMLNDQDLFNDGLDKDCKNNNGITWTYNQGVVLAGLKEIFLLTNDTAYLGIAKKIAYSAIKNLSDRDGILTEPCCGNYNHDLVQFKGIFIKNLGELNTVLHDDRIKQYIRHNADRAWASAQNDRHLFTYRWQGPPDDWYGAATGVALDLMNAASAE